MKNKIQADGENFTYLNPLLKPTSYKPGHPVPFLGIPPDAGFTYGSYACPDCEKEYQSSHANFCPYCKSQKVAKKNQEKEVNSVKMVPTLTESCYGCGLQLATNHTDTKNLSNIYCPNCGENMQHLYNKLKNNNPSKETAMASKAALLKVIAELKAKGEVQLAKVLENQLNAGVDSGVDQEPWTGDKTEDAPNMTLKTEEVNEEVEPSLEIAIARVQNLLKFGIQASIIKKNDKYIVKATDEVTPEETPVVEEEETPILDEETAEMVISANLKKGIQMRAVKVESGFVVAEEIAPEAPVAPIIEENAETTLPEEKANETALNAEKTEENVSIPNESMATPTALPEEKIAAPEEKVEPRKLEDIVLPTEASVKAVVAAIQAKGKFAKVVKADKGWTVTATDLPQDLPPVTQEEPIEEIVQDAVEDSQDVLDDLSEPTPEELASANESMPTEPELEPEMVKEEEVMQAMAKLHKEKKHARVSKVSANKYVVAEEEILETEEINPEDKEVVESAPVEETPVVPTEPEMPVTPEIEEEAEFEPLQPVEELKAEDAEDVVMLSQVSASQEPFYNVIIKGNPVARIDLKAQANAEQIKEYFATEQYAVTLVDAMVKYGVKNTLTKLNAKFYANERPVNVEESVKAKYQDEFYKKYAEAVATVRDDLADRLAMVIAASNKNLWKDDVHRLKVALFDSIVAGLSQSQIKLSDSDEVQDQIIASMIENGFEAGAAPFFGSMLDKAVKHLDTPKEALASMKQMIGEANIQPLEYEDETEEETAEEAKPWETKSEEKTEWKNPEELQAKYKNK